MASKFFPLTIKWILVPAIMATVGYFTLGPRIGDNAYLTEKVDPVKDLIKDSTRGSTANPIEVPEPKGKFNDVNLDVDLTKDDKSKPDSATKIPKKVEYFSPDAGTEHDELSALPDTPANGTSEEPIPTTTNDGW